MIITVRKPMISIALLLGTASFAPLAFSQQTCNATAPCGTAAPCCSEYGFCGTGTFCLGGCNPQSSHAWESCEPAPICKDATYNFHDNSRIVNHTLYDGNATAYDFTLDAGDIYNLNTSAGELALLLTESNGGTRLSTTRYMQYGTVSAKLKTTKWAGVVTAFITMSDVKDEIDWEWPGATTTEAQSNYFWLGEVSYPSTNGAKEDVSSDTYSNYHTYTVDWQEDQLQFSIDGSIVRTVKKSDTTSGYQYPSTPSRVQLSVWPAGINTSAPGTVEWAGGMINWNDPDYTAAGGHFAAVVQSVSVQCAASTNKSLPNSPRSYVYSGLNAQGVPIAYISNATTLLNTAQSRIALPNAGLRSSAIAAVGVAVWMVLFT